jgi:hypothetical protein
MWRMRHFTGFILAIVMSAVLFFGACWGIARIVALHGAGSGLGPAHVLRSTHGLEAAGAVLATGLLLGIMLVAPRMSPLATGLPGLVLLAWSGLLIVHSSYTLRYLPLPGSYESTGLVYLLTHGILGLLGAAMIIPLAVPSRWRSRYEEDDDDDHTEVDDEDFSVPAALGLVP